jgi:hypothetical protein
LWNVYIKLSMNNNDIKIGIINTISMALSFSNIENTLKIVLLVFSILYTGLKIFETIKYKNKNKDI